METKDMIWDKMRLCGARASLDSQVASRIVVWYQESCKVYAADRGQRCQGLIGIETRGEGTACQSDATSVDFDSDCKSIIGFSGEGRQEDKRINVRDGYKRRRRPMVNVGVVTVGKCNMWFVNPDGVVRRYSHDDCMMSRRGPG